MKNFSTRWMMVAGLAGLGALALSAGCSSDSGNTAATDGAAGDHVTTGGGGSSGTDAGTPKVNYTFLSAIQGWTLNTYADPTALNLAGLYPVDGGVDAAPVAADAGAGIAPPSLVFDSTTGKPDPGSLKITVTFTGFNQYVDAVINPTPLVDLSKQSIITCEVILTSGTFSGGAQLHVSTGANFGAYDDSALTAVATPATWSVGKLDLSLATATGFDPSMVAQIGVQFYSGAPTGDAGAGYPQAGMPVVFNLDTVVSSAP